MNKYPNSKKDAFLAKLSVASLDSSSDSLACRCKFNFSYFQGELPGQRFDEWNGAELAKLLDKLAEYSKQPLNYWSNATCGKKGTVLAIYGKFPSKSAFSHPRHVPHQASWARFRLEQKVRLIGFVIPKEYDGKVHKESDYKYDCNTFYVVFLDKNHKFFITEAP